MGLLLSSKLKLRKDGGRAILFSVNPADNMEEDVFTFLYPQQAVILSLFNGSLGLSGIHEAVAYLFNLEKDKAAGQVETLLNTYVNKEDKIASYITDVSEIDLKDARSYDPTDFIVPLEQVDMSNVRCNMPYSIIVLPTLRCYTNCRYCYADRKKNIGIGEFDFAFFKRLLEQIKECGIEILQISGGDLFCRKDAFKLIEHALSEGIYPIIPTKYPLSREQVKHLADIGLSTIQISIDAVKPDIIDWLTATQGYGEKILNTLDYLGEAGIRVRTNSVLTAYNIKEGVKLARYLAELPHVFKSNFTCYSRSLYNHQDDLFCPVADVDEFEKGLEQVKAEFPSKPINFSGRPRTPYDGTESERHSAFGDRAFCTANRRAFVVLPDGRVTICEELYFHDKFIIGDLNKQKIMDVWNSKQALELAYPNQSAVRDGACKECLEFVKCTQGLGRCVRDALIAYGYDRPDWPDPRCPKAPKGNRLG